MCQITSAYKKGPGPTYFCQTTVNESRGDAANMDAHIDALLLKPGIDELSEVTTTWPGGPDPPVHTERAPGESAADAIARHKTACLGALTTNPIDCP